MELNKVSIKAEKARLKMEKRVERRGKERCTKIISSYNDIASLGTYNVFEPSLLIWEIKKAYFHMLSPIDP